MCHIVPFPSPRVPLIADQREPPSEAAMVAAIAGNTRFCSMEIVESRWSRDQRPEPIRRLSKRMAHDVPSKLSNGTFMSH